jgi:hypothetical protein
MPRNRHVFLQSHRVADAHGDAVFFAIRFPAVGVQAVNGLPCQQRFKVTHEGEHDDEFHEEARLRDAAEIGVDLHVVEQIADVLYTFTGEVSLKF